LKPLGILGGTFDPVHYGHLRLAIEIREAVAMREVRLLPARVPNLREHPGASPAQRLAMLEIAIDGTQLTIDTRELQGAGVTYSVETLAALRAEFGTQPLCFILGQDAFNGLPRWHRWTELLDFVHLVIATRPGYDYPAAAELRALLAARAVASPTALTLRPAGGILLQAIPLLPIAATELRARVRDGRNITGLTPAGVVDYIARHQLYRE
jgi:nicotinate-nucleotide adenylyltransferase